MESVLNGSHYVRALTFIVEDMVRSLQWKMFWSQHEQAAYPVLEKVKVVQSTLGSNKRCQSEFEALSEQVQQLHEDFSEFVKECEARSEVCQYLGIILTVANVIKNAVSCEREGNWNLHVAAIEDFLPIFAKLD